MKTPKTPTKKPTPEFYSPKPEPKEPPKAEQMATHYLDKVERRKKSWKDIRSNLLIISSLTVGVLAVISLFYFVNEGINYAEDYENRKTDAANTEQKAKQDAANELKQNTADIAVIMNIIFAKQSVQENLSEICSNQEVQILAQDARISALEHPATNQGLTIYGNLWVTNALFISSNAIPPCGSIYQWTNGGWQIVPE